MAKLVRFNCVLPSLLMDQMYHSGVITVSQYLEYNSCEESRSESKKAIDFIHRCDKRCLESLCKIIRTSESHRLADEILSLSSTSEEASVSSFQESLSSPREFSLPFSGFYQHSVQIYIDEQCQSVVRVYRKNLLDLFEVKFGIQKEQWKVDRNMSSLIQSGQGVHGSETTIVLVCQSYKRIAIEMEHSSYDNTSAQVKAKALKMVLSTTLDTSSDSVKICDAFEGSTTWISISLPLEFVFKLMTSVLDVFQSKALDRNLSLFLPKSTSARMHVGGLPSLSLRPIRHLGGDWSNTGAAIAIPGCVRHMLVCRSSGACLVNIESNEVEEAVGDNLDVLRDCTALVSVGDKMYAFASRLYEVTYKPLYSSFQCIQLGDEDWSGTIAACRYENAILAVRTRKLIFGLLPRKNFYYVDVNTRAAQVLSAFNQPWRRARALVNIVDNRGKEHIIAICGSLWKIDIKVQSGVVTDISSTETRFPIASAMQQTVLNPSLVDSFLSVVEAGINLFNSFPGPAWQCTRSAAVHKNMLYVATGKDHLPGNAVGLFRVDPFSGKYSTVYRRWHTIRTVVDVNRYLVVFTTNKLYVVDVD